MTTPRRDLTHGWCAEGEPLSVALGNVSSAQWQQRTDAFLGVDPFETRAALFLHAFTGYMPRLEDTDGRQAAVDLTLHGDDRLEGIVEVTSTLDGPFQRDSANLRPLLAEIIDEYQGRPGWALSFEHGWTIPARDQRRDLARRIARALEAVDDVADEPVAIDQSTHAYRLPESRAGQLELTGWSANVPDALDLHYLDRLSAYLATSPLVARKLKKLRIEADRLGTTRRHLYLLMASTGDTGGLLPASPSFFTWGVFACPDPITDLWLDGGTGEIYHFDQATGWRFHRI